MPGAVPRTSTFALTNVTLRLALKLANNTLEKALSSDPHLKNGVNTYRGKVTNRAVADSQGIEHSPMFRLL
jgi:alanine dehydrogenase